MIKKVVGVLEQSHLPSIKLPTQNPQEKLIIRVKLVRVEKSRKLIKLMTKFNQDKVSEHPRAKSNPLALFLLRPRGQTLKKAKLKQKVL